MAVDERELTALEQDAAIAARKAAVAVGAIGNDPPDGKLAGQRLALGLKIYSRRQALELAAAGVGGAQLAHHLG